MKDLLLIIVLSISIKPIYGQSGLGNTNISRKDSIELTKTWKIFKKELYLKDINALNLLSLKKVYGHCMFEPININCQPYSSSNKLLALFFHETFSGDSAIILKNEYKIVVYSSIKDRAMKTKYPTQFSIWFTKHSNHSRPG